MQLWLAGLLQVWLWAARLPPVELQQDEACSLCPLAATLPQVGVVGLLLLQVAGLSQLQVAGLVPLPRKPHLPACSAPQALLSSYV